MKHDLPNFDELMKIAANDPKRLDEIRKQATESLIESAPDRYQRRLRGVQFQVDMELRRSKSPLDGCIRISNMMNETLWQLKSTLNEVLESRQDLGFPNSKELDLSEGTPKTAKILEFEV